MNVRYVCKWCVVGTLLALGSSFGLNKTLFAQPVPAEAEQGVQVLTRGPVGCPNPRHPTAPGTPPFLIINSERGLVMSCSLSGR